MDLRLVEDGKTEIDLYKNQLENALAKIAPILTQESVWGKALIENNPYFKNKHIGPRSPISFEGIPSLLALELKLYWARLLADPRMDSRSHLDRRRLPMAWFTAEGEQVLRAFSSSCIAEIPHPEFPLDGHTKGGGKREHNKELLYLFSLFQENHTRPQTETEYVKSGKIEKRN